MTFEGLVKTTTLKIKRPIEEEKMRKYIEKLCGNETASQKFHRLKGECTIICCNDNILNKKLIC